MTSSRFDVKTIGTIFRNEVRTVTRHGSLIFGTSLRYAHEAGTGVYLYQCDYDRSWDEWFEGESTEEEEAREQEVWEAVQVLNAFSKQIVTKR